MLFYRKFLFFILVYHFFLLEKSLHFFIQIIMERFLTPINSIKPKKVRGHRILFTRAEDKLLTSIMETQPFHNWNEVSKFFKNKLLTTNRYKIQHFDVIYKFAYMRD